MSLETWKQEFYTPAEECATTIMALEHGIKKWKGFLPENLKKHEILIYDLHTIKMSKAISCALCLMFYGKGCPKCPLTLSGNNCDKCVGCKDEEPDCDSMCGKISLWIESYNEQL